ncbi:sigma-54 interaction domain-containing protein [Frisingicoccus sp.]|uniref:sigma-54 interaction domain-containing protein n=1 Tax=Frisingicoccus sp. TaxID=1918627 RepID=UPI003AB4E407
MEPFGNDMAYFEDILENYEGSILITDSKGIILLCSRGTCNLTGMSREDFIGVSAYELRERGVFSESALVDCIEAKEPRMTYLLVNGDPDHGIYAYSRPIFDENGKLIRVIAFSQGEAFSEKYNSFMQENSEHMRKLLNTVINSRNEPSYIAVNSESKSTFNFAQQIAQIDTHVIIYGESGTGKEVLAKFIHAKSQRNKEIFVPVNCATIPESLMESEIFGYEKGSFTGANKNGKMGLFELANNGTLFLDEIGELSPQLQPKLLRFLETGEIRKIGGKETKQLNVRIIAATNRNLLKMVKEGTFREDLYYRLNILPLTLPPLRQRPEDILPLAEFFLNKYNKKYGKDVHLADKYLDALVSYSWPGNIRELKNVIQRYVITDGVALHNTIQIIQPNDNEPAAVVTSFENYLSKHTGKTMTYKEYKKGCEMTYFENLLKENKGNMSRLSAITGLHISGIYKKLEKLGLNPKDYQK